MVKTGMIGQQIDLVWTQPGGMPEIRPGDYVVVTADPLSFVGWRTLRLKDGAVLMLNEWEIKPARISQLDEGELMNLTEYRLTGCINGNQ